MKQIIAAMAAMVISASSIAGISLSGKYTGTLNDSSVYTQDLVTTLVGSSADGSVTVTLDKNFAVDDMYVETTMAGVKFKLGEVDGVTSIGAKTTVGIASVGALLKRMYFSCSNKGAATEWETFNIGPGIYSEYF